MVLVRHFVEGFVARLVFFKGLVFLLWLAGWPQAVRDQMHRIRWLQHSCFGRGTSE